jgi:hypothetical protein
VGLDVATLVVELGLELDQLQSQLEVLVWLSS